MYPASPIVNHVKPSIPHNHSARANYAHSHTALPQIEYPDPASVRPAPECLAGATGRVPVIPAAVHRLKVVGPWTAVVSGYLYHG